MTVRASGSHAVILQYLHRLAAGLCLAACALAALPARAHPIVSTDVNRHVTLRVTDDRLEIRYIYEMLEIAALNAARAWDADADGATSDPERDAFAADLGTQLLRDLQVRLDGMAVPLTLGGVRWELGDGAMGLSTWKVYVRFTGRLLPGAAAGVLDYHDGLRPGEVGWKEVVLAAGGSTGVARSSVPAHDLTHELTDYAAIADLPNPNQTSASAVLRFAHAGGSDVAASTRAKAAPSPQHTRREPLQPQASRKEAERAPRPPTQAADLPALSTQPPVPAPAAPATPTPEALPGPQALPLSSFATAWRHYAWPFFKLGVHHIATGYDHLLFLLGLLLLRQSIGRLAAVVTAFTVAHSVTLGLAAAGLVTPPGALVELIIAASIAYVGVIALVRPRTTHGPWIALGFGLAHGFGFAGALGGALEGVAGGRSWLVALACFNLGIEAFQLLVVVAVWPFLQGLDRLSWSPGLRKFLALVVLSAGLGWLAVRIPALAAWPARPQAASTSGGLSASRCARIASSTMGDNSSPPS